MTRGIRLLYDEVRDCYVSPAGKTLTTDRPHP
jgi:hypothetical protein